jgi:heme oxygenase
MTLKESTHEAHVKAEAHPFTKALLAKKITVPQYCDYLYNQLPSYYKLEFLCKQRKLLEDLPGLPRSEAILQDLRALRKQEPVVPEVFPSTIGYLDYLDDLNDQQLLAHVYVRHMGDMYGGQMIKQLVPGQGLMYEFENRSELIKVLRTKLTDDMSTEANICFDFIIELFDELANEHNIQ